MHYTKNIIYTKTVSVRNPVLADFPERMLPAIKEYLSSLNLEKLYCHQAEFFDSALDGRDVVITTATASGKTLSFLLPVLQEILQSPSSRAIFIYPTKALASDQLRSIEPYAAHFGKSRISAGVYDGDSSVEQRQRIRNNCNIILTNPEMLNSAFLPNHSKPGFDFIFSNLKFVIIDELHTYRGAFGSHMGNIFRRLDRISRYYSSSPQFFCSSATIANPLDLAQTICGRDDFKLIEKDGSPAPTKRYHFLQDDESSSSLSQAVELISWLARSRKSFIAFCKSRRVVEVIVKESQDKLISDGSGKSGLIAPYRGGFKPNERKEKEQQMMDGRLLGLVSTNALELGINIGSVGSTVLVGYPNTKASFWQQAGRAGRSGQDADIYLILDKQPFDQYISLDPDWLFNAGSENAVVDPDNLSIQIAHIRAAAAELPLTLSDAAAFKDFGQLARTLLKMNELRREKDRFVWIGKGFPAGDFSLRNTSNSRYKLIDENTGELITEMDETQAFQEIHKDSIYIHDGRQYIVKELDLSLRIAKAREIEAGYYTVPFAMTSLRVKNELSNLKVGRTCSHFGNIDVESETKGHKKMEFHTHQNIGFGALKERLYQRYDTEGMWLELPEEVDATFKALGKRDKKYSSCYNGFAYALQNAAMMLTMTTGSDIGAGSLADLKGCVCIYDLSSGGLGYAEKAHSLVEEILQKAIKLVGGCKCADGCPACVGDYTKKAVLWALMSVFEAAAPPTGFPAPKSASPGIIAKQFDLASLGSRWNEFTEYVKKCDKGKPSYLASVAKAEVRGNLLVLYAQDAFLQELMLESENKRSILRLLSRHVETPPGFALEIDALPDPDGLWLGDKAERRYGELFKGGNDAKKR
ncbi:MAG: DEAD/DEAH box helicase [Clostridiales bacterium]|nr:DEAD/DEAH box helicase [Clostridiales bacterium]